MNSPNAKFIGLLKEMIATPSVSRNEEGTARLLSEFLEQEGCEVRRINNNVIATHHNFDDSKPVILLNSHHDTVNPAAGYTFDPYSPFIRDGKLYGLGSNDAGASVVSLIAAFLKLKDTPLPFNLLLVISAEEECSGVNGIRAVLPEIKRVDMGIVGEPTGMQAAVGERGLVVLDCISRGKSGHAARNEGVNAIYCAMDDINILRNLEFPKESELMGPLHISVTMIEAGSRHNIIPDECRWVTDIRTTDAMTNEEVVEFIRSRIKAEIKPRSTRLRASALPENLPLAKAAQTVGAKPFLSPTMSDMTQMAFPTLKIGPGDSARSHSADEFICLSEIDDAVEKYVTLIKNIKI